MRALIQNILFVSPLLLALYGGPTPATAAMPSGECDISSNAETSACATHESVIANNGAIITKNEEYPIVAARTKSSSTAVVPIDAYGRCRYVDNAGTQSDFFIPFRSEMEWTSFIGNHPNVLSLEN